MKRDRIIRWALPPALVVLLLVLVPVSAFASVLV
jgi:hypothetical protein